MVCGTHVPAVCIGVMLIPRTSAIARPPAGGLLNVERLRAAARPAPKLRVVSCFARMYHMFARRFGLSSDVCLPRKRGKTTNLESVAGQRQRAAGVPRTLAAHGTWQPHAMLRAHPPPAGQGGRTQRLHTTTPRPQTPFLGLDSILLLVGTRARVTRARED